MTDVLLVLAGLEECERSETVDGHWTAAVPEGGTFEWSLGVRKVCFSVKPTAAPPSVAILGITQRTRLLTPGNCIETWDILPAVADASIIHVCRPHTRAGEVAVLAAKVLGKPLAVSDLLVDTSELGRSLGLLFLADTVICQSDAEADHYPGYRDIEVLDVSADGWVAQLGAIYRRLSLAGGSAQ